MVGAGGAAILPRFFPPCPFPSFAVSLPRGRQGTTRRKLRRSRASLRFFPFLSAFLFSSPFSNPLLLPFLFFSLFSSFYPPVSPLVSLCSFTDEILCIFYTHVHPINPFRVWRVRLFGQM